MAEVLIDKIIADARTDAASIENDARIKATLVAEGAESEIAAICGRAKQTAALAVAEVQRRYKTDAVLAGRKITLRGQRRAVAAAFELAAERATRLNKANYLKIIEGMLAYAEDGDVVFIAASDKSDITDKFVAGVAAKRGIALTLGRTYRDIKGGIILKNKGCEKNLSLETELDALREERESEICGVFFKA